MKDGFLRVAAATPKVALASCRKNAAEIISLTLEASNADASIVVFPELCITGYSCGDLFKQQLLLDAALNALTEIASGTADCDTVSVVGLPVLYRSELFDCAAVLFRGEILGIVPKTVFTSRNGLVEQRYFSDKPVSDFIMIEGKEIPFGTDLLFKAENFEKLIFGIEIGSDALSSVSPSVFLTGAGATLMLNPAAFCEAVGSAKFRRSSVENLSSRNVCAYVLANAGDGESTSTCVFSGHSIIAENGNILAESELFSAGLTFADIDLGLIASERLRGFDSYDECFREIVFTLPKKDLKLMRKIASSPFIPSNPADLSDRCEEILAIQSVGLASRLRHTNSQKAVIGLSGGLDSTLALLIIARAFDRLGLDRKGIIAVTMPCFGTTKRTKSNAELLAAGLGCTFMEIPIAEAVTVHLRDINHSIDTLDVTYENAQARERTQVLMDIANQCNGLVVGTGDLSELALGWATYNGDHMSMYGVNASVPKTLMRHLVSYVASTEPALSDVLLDILATPVSPELLPPKDGVISQETESIVGPYELHDFFLYYTVRYGFSPSKILRMAEHTFDGVYSREVILGWLKMFFRRFFTQQFKRSCLPDGAKVGSVSLSPHTDWKMPSDASYALWMAEIDEL